MQERSDEEDDIDDLQEPTVTGMNFVSHSRRNLPPM
jgi:hypothetical protein